MSKATKIDEQLLAELLNSPVSMATTPQKRGADGRFIDSRPKEDCKILVSLTLGQREYIKKFAKLHGLRQFGSSRCRARRFIRYR